MGKLIDDLKKHECEYKHGYVAIWLMRANLKQSKKKILKELEISDAFAGLHKWRFAKIRQIINDLI